MKILRNLFAIFFVAYFPGVLADPVITVINKTALGSITFGYTSYEIVNSTSTRRGSGGVISVSEQSDFDLFPPMSTGDQLTLNNGLRIVSQDKSMTSDGSPTCDASGLSKGLRAVLGRGYMLQNDKITVLVKAEKGVIPGIYDASCTYSN